MIWKRNTIKMKKSEIRLKYKALRNNFWKWNWGNESSIANKLITLPWEKTYFHFFSSITEHNEVNTEFILHLLSGKDKEIITKLILI
jgi:5-formyltetrahydrofolate cyclo-ligase